MPTTTGEGRRDGLRRANGPWHQQQMVAFTGFTVPQRGHDARYAGRCSAPPQAPQNFESAGLSCAQFEHFMSDMDESSRPQVFADKQHCRPFGRGRHPAVELCGQTAAFSGPSRRRRAAGSECMLQGDTPAAGHHGAAASLPEGVVARPLAKHDRFVTLGQSPSTSTGGRPYGF